MPLQPNFIEHFLINRGIIPGILSDIELPMLQFFAMIGAMETGFFTGDFSKRVLLSQ